MPRWRQLKNTMATATVSTGGVAVLGAILLIFFYLLYEVVPLFSSATASKMDSIPVSSVTAEQLRYTTTEEQGEVALTIDTNWQAKFVRTLDGAELLARSFETNSQVTAFAAGNENLLAFAYRDSQIKLNKHSYRLSYPNDKRLVTPSLDQLYTDQELGFAGAVLQKVAANDSEDALLIAGISVAGEILARRFEKTTSFLSDELTLEAKNFLLPKLGFRPSEVFVGSSQRWLYFLANNGSFAVVDLKRADEQGLQLIADRGTVFGGGGSLTASAMLLGGISLLTASSNGELSQFFMVRTEAGPKFQRVREFDTTGHTVTHIVPEHRRKVFLTLSDDNFLQAYSTTAHRRSLGKQLSENESVSTASVSPRGNILLLATDDGNLERWNIDNEHPDVSWSALWEEVWYESYDQPEYVWQSSASNNDFEPKYSFTPLAFGTLKAAFYAMLVATPLAICGAIYTAYFMAPALRRKVKPVIELMEALPTVILGFLAGLWLAPFIEDKLTGVFTVLLVMPVGVLAFAFAWSRLPLAVRSMLPEGWHIILLIPVITALGYFSFAINDSVEIALFGGDMRVWITQELGISFDQRNALVVGIAMGMAVIPTIFSIAEDAIFSVPKHLSYGSLALGATPWQTLVGVVLPTASPGIFSGLMIGTGRAVGETMIVLMATGNTPIMDANIFEGMRTLAANIAVEVPETEVDSSHYRVLFLAAFVLFAFTFVVNTAAEIIRQRLRVKYGSL
ncbi:MAG: phosphate transport system permease protein [Halioglobus sp.]|jgi:phosphate transport system permease protein